MGGGISTTLNAQRSDGFFRGGSDDSYSNRDDGMSLGDAVNENPTPLGSGLLIMMAAGAGYAVARRKRKSNSKIKKTSTTFFLALALILGMTQCKKSTVAPTTDNGIHITLNASYGGDKTVFNPATCGFVWSATTEYINVGGSSSGYLGQLHGTGDGTSTTIAFEGTLDKDPKSGETLYFFYLGNGDHVGASTIDISNQDGTLGHVTDYHIAISNGIVYTGQESFSATLNMKTAIAYFNTIAFAGEKAYLHGEDIYSVLNVNYQGGTISPRSKGYINTGAASEGVYVALIPSTEAETTLKFESNSKKGSEITFLRGIKPGHYYSNGNEALTISTPTEDITNDAIKGLFSVSEGGKMVRFSKGNLQYTRESIDKDWSTGSWSFMTNQYDVIETGDVSSNYGSETAIGLFGWGTSGWMARASEVNYYYKPYQTNGSNGSYYGPTTTSTSITGTYANGDWGVYNGANITNGGGYSTWRVMTSNEWNYLLNTRSTSTRYAKATVGTKRGVLLFPDDYTHPSGAKALSDINGITNNWPSYDISDLLLMEANGAVFLPAAGYRTNNSDKECIKLDYYTGNYENCYYWTSTSSSSTSAYRMVIGNWSPSHNNGGYRYLGCAVRLVRDVE